MLTWLKRLFTPPPRLVEMVNRLDDVDERLEYLALELKRLRGRVTGAERKTKGLEGSESDELTADPDRSAPRGTAAAKRALRGF